jgi:hypothetical protein
LSTEIQAEFVHDYPGGRKTHTGVRLCTRAHCPPDGGNFPGRALFSGRSSLFSEGRLDDPGRLSPRGKFSGRVFFGGSGEASKEAPTRHHLVHRSAHTGKPIPSGSGEEGRCVLQARPPRFQDKKDFAKGGGKSGPGSASGKTPQLVSGTRIPYPGIPGEGELEPQG